MTAATVAIGYPVVNRFIVPENVDLRSEGWYVAIPPRPRIVTSAEFQVMLAELQPKIEQVLRRYRSTSSFVS